MLVGRFFYQSASWHGVEEVWATAGCISSAVRKSAGLLERIVPCQQCLPNASGWQGSAVFGRMGGHLQAMGRHAKAIWMTGKAGSAAHPHGKNSAKHAQVVPAVPPERHRNLSACLEVSLVDIGLALGTISGGSTRAELYLFR